ncbi:hypothetical protein OOK31_16560 [Streptomyces sp. NBC_00249]|uniref:hypothetical protein n=1 Tax=Streptomyces sp. NBC_00249 TaxID=2975690 RepID=UPI00224FEB54|nr:hypothetical protein [Streptomyces sp. NBC_00249]MCX5195497.1 hypothetical protein [Streptomyces sp. NBC_00249]
MTIHRPGLPGDLPPAGELWARWALVAVLEATTEAEGRGVHRTGHWIDGGGLHLDDCGCTWWCLAPMGEGRYVLYGEDESSDVKWHEPAVDMLAGGPDWLPYETLRELGRGWELGCVYWFEDGAWARAPYPEGVEDDGLDCGISRFVVRRELLGLLDGVGQDCTCDPGPEPAHTAAGLLEAAERRRLAPEVLESFAAGCTCGERDLSAMRRALDLAGLAGQGQPA